MNDSSPSDKKNENKQALHKARMQHDWDNLIEDMIQDGMANGLFDNLKGAGKPLNLQQNQFGAEYALAHSILKESDAVPAWIGDRNQILQDQAALRADIGRQWGVHQQKFAANPTAVARDRLTLSWDDACQKWLDQIARLNKRITTYNLKRPSENLELFQLDLERELKRVGAPRYLR